jgi:hypothetical protein
VVSRHANPEREGLSTGGDGIASGTFAEDVDVAVKISPGWRQKRPSGIDARGRLVDTVNLLEKVATSLAELAPIGLRRRGGGWDNIEDRVNDVAHNRVNLYVRNA